MENTAPDVTKTKQAATDAASQQAAADATAQQAATDAATAQAAAAAAATTLPATTVAGAPTIPTGCPPGSTAAQIMGIVEACRADARSVWKTLALVLVGTAAVLAVVELILIIIQKGSVLIQITIIGIAIACVALAFLFFSLHRTNAAYECFTRGEKGPAADSAAAIPSATS